MNRNFLFYIIASVQLFIFHSLSYSQDKVPGDLNCGYYIDVNGIPINGFFDFSYSPKKSMEVNYFISDNQTVGSYKDLNDKIHTGKLKLTGNDKKIEFNDGEKDSEIEAKDCKGLKIGADTFLVINGYNLPTESGMDKEKHKIFVKFLKKRNKYSLYKYHYKQFIGNADITVYFLKQDSSDSLIVIPKKKSLLINFANNYFGSCQIIKDLVAKKALKYSNVPKYFDYVFFEEIYTSKGKIYLNRYWNIKDDSSDYVYYANVTDIKDTILNFKFYLKNNTSLFSAEYSSFNPVIKNGKEYIYYPNGDIRKASKFKKNKIDGNVIEYFEGNKYHYVYTIDDDQIKFNNVFSQTGANLLNEEGKGIEKFYDEFENRTITRRYNEFKLETSAFYNKDTSIVYQYTDDQAEYKKIDKILTKSEINWKLLITTNSGVKKSYSYPGLEYTDKAIRNNVSGMVYVKFIVGEDGIVKDYSIIKGISDDLDTTIINYFHISKIVKHWSTGSYMGNKVTEEIIIPIDFEIRGSEPQKFYYNPYFNNMRWNNPNFPGSPNYRPPMPRFR
jgi:hypothetical protein